MRTPALRNCLPPYSGHGEPMLRFAEKTAIKSNASPSSQVKLSLQFHRKRAEHWVVIQGKATVQIGDEEFETGPGEYRYIPLGEKHRLTNIGETELVLIEVQVGIYLGEDDIVRLDDDYGRA